MNELQAEILRNDPRVAKAKTLLLSALREHQRPLTKVRPPHKERAITYRELLDQLAKARGSKTYYPYIGSGLGNGALVELLDGSVKYDFITGIGVHFLGHSHPILAGATIDAALSDIVMQGHLQQNEDSLKLCQLLTKLSGFDHCFLTTSGTMANENALKIAFQARPGRTRILAPTNCFAGRTWTLSQISDRPQYRQGLPLNVQVDYFPFHAKENLSEKSVNAVHILQDHLTRYPSQHAAVILELIQGEGGSYPCDPQETLQLMQHCKKHDILVIVDEVQSFGRTSHPFSYHYFGLEEFVDIVTVGKMSQVCATLFSSELTPKPNLINQTFTSSTAAIKASIALLHHLIEGGYYGKNGKIVQLTNHFIARLKEISRRHPQLVKGPYGLGAMVVFTPFAGKPEQVTRLAHALFEAGVIAFLSSYNPTRLRFLIPAGAVTTADMDEVAKILEKCLIKTGDSL